MAVSRNSGRLKLQPRTGYMRWSPMHAAVIAWHTNNAWNVLGHSAGAFITSSGLGGLTALGAAYIAWRVAKRTIKANADDVTRQLHADQQRNLRAERMEVIVTAIESLAEAKVNVRQRDIAYREYAASGVLNSDAVAHREKWRDEAVSRHWKLPAAGARLELYGFARDQFDASHDAINRYSRLSYEGADRETVRKAEAESDAAIRAFTNQLATTYRSVPDST
jgi:hypothetical protein